MPSGNANFSTLAATTLQNFGNKIFDNVMTNNTLAYHLYKKGNVKITSGGRQFVHQVMYSQNSTFAARAHTGTVPTTFTEPLSATEWNIKTISGSIAMYAQHIAMNAGDKEKLLDFVNAKKFEAETAMQEILGDQVFNTTAGADDFDGIPRIISETPSVDTDVVVFLLHRILGGEIRFIRQLLLPLTLHRQVLTPLIQL